MQPSPGVDHIHDVSAGVALLLAWEQAKRRGALAMKWDGAQWVVAIGGEWVALEVPKSFFSSHIAKFDKQLAS